MNFTYDINGNMYITKDDEHYMITINKENNIELEKVLNKNYSNNISNTKKINKQNALHIKTIENAIDELDEDDNDEDREKFNDIYDKYHTYIYNPEQRFYHDDDPDESEDDHDYVNFAEKERQIKLYSDNIILQTDFSFDIPIYEALVIYGDIGTNNLVFRSEIVNDQALYRLTFYTSGIVLLNIIGTQIVKFTINLETLEIIKEHYKNIKVN